MDQQNNIKINNIIVGSHNSFSYLPVKQWYLKPFNFIAKCQNKDICAQILNNNALDIRVCFINKQAYFAHGLITYKGNVTKLLKHPLEYYNHLHIGHIRVILEKYTDNDIDIQNSLFRTFCQWLKVNFPNVTFYGGNYKKTWEKIYDFKTIEDDQVNQFVSSMRNDANLIERICPKLYAIQHNKQNKFYTTNGINLFDFI